MATNQRTIKIDNINIPILPMAFLTFAEAKVVAPPIVPINKLVTFYKIIKGSLFRSG